MFAAVLLAASLVGPCSSGSCDVSSGGGAFGLGLFGGHRVNYSYPSSMLMPLAPAPQLYPVAPPATYTYIQPNPPAVVSTPAPQVYSISDGHGMTWTHSNPTYLKAWVAGRKAALDSANARVVVRTKSVSCSCNGEACVCTVPGECGRPGCKSVAVVPPVPPFP